MPYNLECDCGSSIQVEETAAGSIATCKCGSAVLVPTLRELRGLAGAPQSGLSVFLEIESMLLAGKLPQEHHCVICGLATDGVISCWTECEKAYIEHQGPSPWTQVLAYLVAGVLGLLAVAVKDSKSGGAKEWGQDRIFSLPLRVCDSCRPELSDVENLKEAMRSVPLYRRLLEKYPEAVVSVV